MNRDADSRSDFHPLNVSTTTVITGSSSNLKVWHTSQGFDVTVRNSVHNSPATNHLLLTAPYTTSRCRKEFHYSEFEQVWCIGHTVILRLHVLTKLMAAFYIDSGGMVWHSTFVLWYCAAHGAIPDSSHPYKWDARGSVYAIHHNAYPFPDGVQVRWGGDGTGSAAYL